MRALRMIIQVAVSLVMIGTAANAQPGQMSDSDYIQKAISAAPSAVGNDATVIRVDMDKPGNMRTLRTGTNGFTCMIMGPDAMCNDANSMEFFGAMMKHEPPPDKIGISYMLRGDDG
ncbi:MAG TPA: hypothetical protein VGN39_00100, partial [Terriglobales bacterium]|nr:hypothetical protein [Terriglobales bacterium]